MGVYHYAHLYALAPQPFTRSWHMQSIDAYKGHVWAICTSTWTPVWSLTTSGGGTTNSYFNGYPYNSSELKEPDGSVVVTSDMLMPTRSKYLGAQGTISGEECSGLSSLSVKRTVFDSLKIRVSGAVTAGQILTANKVRLLV